MERFFAILCEGVHRFEGTVDKFTGDGIMALFGAPIAHEDHAQRACYAALHLQEELAAYAAELRREQGLSFSVRMGINSGEVVVGTIGEDLGMDYTAIGHTVGLAQRMEQLAEPGKAYLTEHTGVARRGLLRAHRPRRVRGQGRQRAAARLRADRGRRRPRAARRLTRARLLAVRRPRRRAAGARGRAGARPLAGRPQVIGIVGEAGVGKSRLCDDVRAALPGAGASRSTRPPARRTRSRSRCCRCSRSCAPTSTSPSWTRDQTARERIAGKLLLLDESFARGPAADLRLPRRARSRAPGAAHGPRGAPAPAARRSPSA